MAEGRTAFAQDADGWYQEPVAATEFLLKREPIQGGVWDPACGAGNIVTACLAAGLPAVGTDLRDRVTKRSRNGPVRPWWFIGTGDFLTQTDELWNAVTWMPNVVTNAPYGGAKLAEAFIRKAVALHGVQKVCAFVNSKFLFSDGRAEGLYAEIPPDRIYPVRPRPSCPPGAFLRAGGKAEGGIENFVWLIWDLAQPTGRTEFIWR